MRLDIYCNGSVSDVRYSVEKWTFHDVFMGEQYLTFDVKSPNVIQWQVGDHCFFRGQEYVLNYVPSCRQQARPYDSGDAFVYEGIKLNSASDELTRCIILDVVPTTGDYDQYEGTNYTGSSTFSLYCGETEWTDGGGVTHTYAPVHTLADRIKANLDRMYPNSGWQIKVNDESCHSEDYVISFNKWTASQALAEVHNTFKCDYAIIGRTIYIGYSLPELTSSQSDPEGEPSPASIYYFGYGKGYPTLENGGGTALFEIKKVANPNQNIITRLRAYGSTRNLPYRYYMDKYKLPQTMYVHNLQLPDTFLPYSSASDPEHKYTRYKVDGNSDRDSTYGEGVLRHVLGETNDAYIDKGDDAASCAEGIREGAGAWDGSQENLEEIYPTIQEMTYGELRASGVPDVFGITGSNAYKSNGAANPYYQDAERVDEVFDIGEDCNIGDGIVPLAELENRTYTFNVGISAGPYTGITVILTPEKLLHTIENVQYEGNYSLSPTFDNVYIQGQFTRQPSSARISISMTYTLRVVQVSLSNGSVREIARYVSDEVIGQFMNGKDTFTMIIPVVAIPDLEVAKEGGTPKVSQIHVTEMSNIKVYLDVRANAVGETGAPITFSYQITTPHGALEPNLVWGPLSGESIAEESFHIYLKELGFDLSEARTIEGDTPTITMKTGDCVGRTFDILGVSEYTDDVSGKRGWSLELSRVSDDAIHVYYPNSQNTLKSGDRFILSDIELPDAYIKAAEVRLLRAATDYLADNCETKYTHEPSLNDIYLQQNYDRMLEEGREEESIFWKLYAGLKFPFRGIPESGDETEALPLLDITISQVEIQIGEKETPQVTIQLNDDIEQTTIQKLTTAVDRMYNAIGGYAGNSSYGVSASSFYELLKTEGAKRFLSRQNDDTAKGKITFEQKTALKGGASVGGDLHSDGYVSGMSGWSLDPRGNMEVETIHARSALITDELRVNRQQAQEGDTIFAENDQIDAVEVEEIGGIQHYILTLKEKWEGYFTAQEVGNIIRGKINTLAAKEAGASDYSSSEYDPYMGKDAGGNKYYESWMRVVDTHNTNPVLGVNQIRVVLYSDDYVDPVTGETHHEVPAGKNFPPCELMTVARWGCFQDPNEQGISEGEKQSRIRRQQLFYISTSDGRITKLTHVNKPILEETNYGTTLGTLPDFVKNWSSVSDRLIDGRDYLYAQGIVVGDFIKVDIAGQPLTAYVDCGEWVDGSQIAEPSVGHGIYLKDEKNELTLQYETHDVWHYGNKWRALAHQPTTQNGQLVYVEPKWNTTDYWQMIEGNDSYTMEFDSDNGYAFRINYVIAARERGEEILLTTITPHVFYGGGQVDISADVALGYWRWERCTERTKDNPTGADRAWNEQHKETRVLNLTSLDMPVEWRCNNKAIFTCYATLNDGKNTVIVRNQIIA